MVHSNPFDVAIVGGGPAGQTAAIYMARFRRTVALLDSGHSRLSTIPLTRNFPGFPDGITGRQLLERLRLQAACYPIQALAEEVQSIERHGGGFRLSWSQGEIQCRLVLLATGTSDVVPQMPHLKEAVTEGLVRYCPVCDGYEVAGQHVGVLANSRRGVDEAIYLRHFTSRLTLFMLGREWKLAPADEARLKAAGVGLAKGSVEKMLPMDRQVAVFHNGAQTRCDSVYGALGLEVRSSLARGMGAGTDREGYLLTNRHQETTVEGLFAAGDVVKGLNQIAVGCGAAAIAGAAMHRRLLGARP